METTTTSGPVTRADQIADAIARGADYIQAERMRIERSYGGLGAFRGTVHRIDRARLEILDEAAYRLARRG